MATSAETDPKHVKGFSAFSKVPTFALHSHRRKSLGHLGRGCHFGGPTALWQADSRSPPGGRVGVIKLHPAHEHERSC